MQVLNVIRRNPVAGLLVVAAGILGWIGAGLVNLPAKPEESRALVGPRRLPTPEAFPDAIAVDVTNPEIPSEVRARTLTLLPKLRPGMTRVEVEGILGPPTADGIHPVTVTDGQARYRAAYDLADPDPPATIRPIKNFRLFPPRQEPGAHVALEFDASKPGHPLIEILYLDPLF
jgi:hypothetical protein